LERAYWKGPIGKGLLERAYWKGPIGKGLLERAYWNGPIAIMTPGIIKLNMASVPYSNCMITIVSNTLSMIAFTTVKISKTILSTMKLGIMTLSMIKIFSITTLSMIKILSLKTLSLMTHSAITQHNILRHCRKK
jgi:hypothetical protein